MRHILVMAALDAPSMARLGAGYEVHRLDLAPDPEALLAAGARDVEAVVTDGHRGLDAALVARLPRLGLVASGSAGVEGIDRAALAARGVPLANVGPALADEVADLALLLVLAAWRGLAALDAHVRTGAWARGPAPLGRALKGRRAGVAGAGPVGQAVARRLDALGMAVAMHARRDPGLPWPFEPDLRRLAAASDVLVLALPGGEATRGLVGRDIVAALGPGGVLVNVGRGTVVDEGALIDALGTGALGAAGLDVFATEPDVDPRLLALANVVLSPHAGSATVETRAAMSALVVDALDAYFAGRPLPATLPPP